MVLFVASVCRVIVVIRIVLYKIHLKNISLSIYLVGYQTARLFNFIIDILMIKFTNVSLLTVVASVVLLAGCTSTENTQNTKLAQCLTTQ